MKKYILNIVSSKVDIENVINSFNIDLISSSTVDLLSDEVLNKSNILILESIDFSDINNIKNIKEYKGYILFVKEEIDNNIRELLISNISKFKFIKIPFSNYELEYIIKELLDSMETKKRLKILKAQKEALLNNNPYVTWIKDLENKYTDINDKFKKEFKGKIHNTNELSDIDLFDEETGKYCEKSDFDVLKHKKQFITEEIFKESEGYKVINTYKYPVLTESGDLVGSVGSAIDVTPVKNYDFNFDILLENMHFAIFFKNYKGKILRGNGKFFEYYSFKIDEFRKKNGERFTEEELDEVVKKEDEEVLYKKIECIFERYVLKEGRLKILEVHKKPILDITSNTLGVLGVYIDVTESRTYRENIEKLVNSDFLTKMNNRRSLYGYIKKLNEEKSENIGAMILDLDKFKVLNDIYGHKSGDRILVFIANELTKICCDSFVARSGGDEFIVIYKNTTEEIMKKNTDIILNRIINEFAISKEKYLISTNIGLALNESFIKVEEVLNKAEFALLKAKKMGKNKSIFYTAELNEERRFNLELDDDLNKAFENEEIELFYQPQYTTERKIIGLEALFRWKNEKYSKIPVIKLIKRIEQSNLITKLGEYVIRKAASFSKSINQFREEKIIVYVNISALHLMNSNFTSRFVKILNEVGVEPKFMGIELTETVLLDNIDKNIDKLNSLKALGIKIALDDFGTGYSSLNYLIKLPISKVKLDKSFVRKINSGDEYRKVLGLIVEICHSFNMEVIAEGVEYEEEVEILKKLEVEYIQGYLLAKPMPSENLIELLEA